MKRWIPGIAAVLTLGGVAWAQEGPPEGPPPPFRGGQGGPGGPGFGGPGGRRMPRGPMRPMMVPVTALGSLLDLSKDQKKKIAEIQAKWRKENRPPQPPQPGEFPEPPSEEERERRRDAEKQASDAIAAVLNDAQKNRLPIVLKALQVLRDVGAAPPMVAELELSEEQIEKLAALAPKEADRRPGEGYGGPPQDGPRGRGRGGNDPRRALREKVLALLNENQRDLLESMPQGGPGGPGFGGPPPGRPGFGGPDGPEGPPPNELP